MNNTLRLDGKVLVIVGGTSGLGLSAAAACLREGARVVIVGRNSDKCDSAVQQLGKGVRAVTGDAAEATTSERAIATACEAFGGLDGLYHVAGGTTPFD